MAIGLSGCAKKKESPIIETYRAYYTQIEQNTRFVDHSDAFTYHTEMVKTGENQYTYYVIFDTPRVSMKDIVIMAVENGISYQDNHKMMPSSGIFDEKSSMIPYQENTKNHFVKGIVISGQVDQPQVNLKMIVEWKDDQKQKTLQQFIEANITSEE